MHFREPSTVQPRATIVIAEDDVATRAILRRVLEREHFRVIAVENGRLACEAVRTERPDVVLLDWMMPVMDGRAALEELSASPDTRGIPVVMLTSNSQLDERIIALEAGAQDLLSKPCEPRELLACIEQQLRRRDYLAADADSAFLAERDALRAASERRYRLLAEAMPQIVWIADPQGELMYSNRAWYEYSGARPEHGMTGGWLPFVHAQDRESARHAWAESLASGRPYEVQLRLRRVADGMERWHVARATATCDESGTIVEWVVSCTDIHDYRIAGETRAILDTIGSIVSIRTDLGFVEYASPHWSQYTGSGIDAALGFGWRDFVHPEDLPLVAGSPADQTNEAGATRQYEMRIRAADGDYQWFQTQTTVLPPASAGKLRWLDTSTNVNNLKTTQTALALSAAELEHLAHHDPMTNLPNRTRLEERLTQAIALAKRAKTEVLVLFVDLDRFKVINDTRGHAAGDRVLTVTSERITEALRTGDVASRVGGDEFVLVCATPAAAQDAALLATRLLDAIGRPIDLDGEAVTIGASIGISMFPADGSEGAELIRKADGAMYAAKQNGRNLFCIHPPA
jgi:diguanylate cyclase (GGDEF)-like protein/PAS domain S-box-containing protein